MKSEWKIKKMPLGPGEYLWQVYRLLDTSKPHHSGNEETYGKLAKSREEAEAILEECKE